MLLPLFGLAFGVVISSVLGAAVIAVHPQWKLNSTNITLFVVGSFTAAVCSSLVYTWIFADENRRLHSAAAVLGYLATLLVAVLLGGTLAVFIGRKLFRPSE
ncbi:hypothetical protein EJV47_07075 [Hymenobacter gummosus]|uniref:Uncharacterized protein n=1 Tax=Hymenobacter gummosus TaxID=1776032 RepID=A0A3S0H6T3_9BACT|nr:hypothetical protein [Hymenobacter gummosus]RTQ51554.1 hypothetical protein EJV47_07075 [Hymenobacter gummosus]